MGVYDLLYSTMSVLTPLITLQISDAAYRWMIRKEKIDESITTTFQFLIANSLIFSLIILVVNQFFFDPLLRIFCCNVDNFSSFSNDSKIAKRS